MQETSMPAAESMKVIQIEQFGGPEVLREQSVQIPVPGDGEILVKVDAAGVNPVDYKIRAGKYPAVKQDKLPYVLGRDVAGTVIRCGAHHDGFSEGDTIIAMPGIDRGGYAEYVLVKTSEAALKPGSLDFIAAGAVPLAALTAWQGLFKHGQLRAGQRVLIQGGAGGVGHFAIQFAKAKGAYVITTASGPHLEFVRSLGADEVIDYKKERFEDKAGQVDLVYDLIGGETQERSWAVLRPGGRLVSTLTEPSKQKAAERRAQGMRYTVEESGADLAEIAQLIDDGRVKVSVTRTFPLAQAASAQQFLEREHPAGKVVLTVSGHA
jgi:NADPH:quinone reductase-like Zn-dependent oxidoreductase